MIKLPIYKLLKQDRVKSEYQTLNTYPQLNGEQT